MTTRSHHPGRLGFFELLHLLERYHHDAPPIGGLGPVRAERVRLRPHLGFEFPVRDLEQVEILDATDTTPARWRLTSTFLGLYGTESPLPKHYTTRLLGDDPPEREPVRAFLDLFHHRIHGLLYRAWKKYRYHVSVETGDGPPDRFSEHLLALIGYGTPRLAEQAGIGTLVKAVRMLRWGGLTTQRPRSAAVIQCLLQDHFADVPVRVKQFIPRTIRIPPHSRTFLGGRSNGARRRAVTPRRLGRDAVCGVRMRDRSSRIRVVLGPMNYKTYRGLLPGTDRRQMLDELTRRARPIHLTHDVQLVLRGAEVPALRLSRDGDARLGWTSWVARGPGPDRSVRFGPMLVGGVAP